MALLWPDVVRDRVGIKAATDVVVDAQGQLSSVGVSVGSKTALQRSLGRVASLLGMGCLLTEGAMGMSWSLTSSSIPQSRLLGCEWSTEGTRGHVERHGARDTT